MSDLEAHSEPDNHIPPSKRKRSPQEQHRDGEPPARETPPEGSKRAKGQPKEKNDAKPGRRKAGLKREPSDLVSCVIDWPPSFKSLEKTHRALN